MKTKIDGIPHKYYWWKFWYVYESVSELNQLVADAMRKNNMDKVEGLCATIALKLMKK